MAERQRVRDELDEGELELSERPMVCEEGVVGVGDSVCDDFGDVGEGVLSRPVVFDDISVMGKLKTAVLRNRIGDTK